MDSKEIFCNEIRRGRRCGEFLGYIQIDVSETIETGLRCKRCNKLFKIINNPLHGITKPTVPLHVRVLSHDSIPIAEVV